MGICFVFEISYYCLAIITILIYDCQTKAYPGRYYFDNNEPDPCLRCLVRRHGAPPDAFIVYALETIIIGAMTLLKLLVLTIVRRKDDWYTGESRIKVSGLVFMLFSFCIMVCLWQFKPVCFLKRPTLFHRKWAALIFLPLVQLYQWRYLDHAWSLYCQLSRHGPYSIYCDRRIQRTSHYDAGNVSALWPHPDSASLPSFSEACSLHLVSARLLSWCLRW